jgi:hypothetical protein
MLIIYPTYAPKAEITISFNFEGVSSSIKLPANSSDIITTPYKISDNTINITGVSVQPNEDEDYKYGVYKIIDKVVDEVHEVYYGLVNILNVDDDNISEKLEELAISTDFNEMNILLDMCAADVNNMTDEEYNEYCANNSYITSIIIEKTLWDNDGVVIYNSNNDNITNLFDIVRSDIVLNNKTYALVSLITDVESSAFIHNNKMFFKLINDNQFETIEITYSIKTI